MEPVDFSSLRKTMGDSGLLANERPSIPDKPAHHSTFLNQEHHSVRQVVNDLPK